MTRRHRDYGDPALLHSALELASRGWHVFPCAPGSKRPALPGNWQQHATTDPLRIRDWWTVRPCNIGISCGPSGLVVIDLDISKEHRATPDTGAASLAALCERAGQPFPLRTFTVATPSGGTHLYFRAPQNAIPNSAGKLGPLIDVRAEGGYVLAPGSRINGRAYTITNPALPALLPAWIARSLREPSPQTVPCTGPSAGRAHAFPYARAALDAEAHRVTVAREGTRNDTLNRAAFSLGQLVAGGILSDAEVVTALADAASQSGLPGREALRTIRSGLTAGTRLPRSPRLQTPLGKPLLPKPQQPRDGPGPNPLPQQRMR